MMHHKLLAALTTTAFLLMACSSQTTPQTSNPVSTSLPGSVSASVSALTVEGTAESHVPVWAEALDYFVERDFLEDGRLRINPGYYGFSEEQRAEAYQAILAGRKPEELVGADLHNYMMLDYSATVQSRIGERPADEKEPLWTGKPGETLKMDIDGDGKQDTIEVRIIDESNCEIVVNNTRMQLDLMVQWVAIIDIDAEDSYREICVYDWEACYPFRYIDGNLVTISPLGQFWSGSAFAGDGTAYIYFDCAMLFTYAVPRHYRLTENYEWEPIEEEFYPIDYTMMVCEPPLMLYREKSLESEQLYLDDYCYIELLGTDAEEWVQVQAPSGETGWIKVQYGNQIFDGEDWRFHGLYEAGFAN